MKRRVFATRAQWLDTEKPWALESGWVRDFADGTVEKYTPFKLNYLPELVEPPSYFNREVIQAFQMSWRDLRHYIFALQNTGFHVSPLTVPCHKKTASPLIPPHRTPLAVP